MSPVSLSARRGVVPARDPRLGRVQVERHKVISPLVDARHDGLRIAHLTDLHVATAIRPRRLQRCIELVNAARPDLVVFTGDYVCSSVRSLPLLEEALARLEVPAWATLGNHDHWAGAGAVIAALERAGVRVLVNAHETLPVRGAPLHLVGIDDHHSGHADPEAAFAKVGSGGTRLVLTHDPNAADAAARHGAALVLAGHTHGGQICLPRVTERIARRVGVKYLGGFFRVGETLLYVNRGLGAAVPVRLAAPMEIAFLALRSATRRQAA
jgi:predicted MPP superfamily phosphohydrolase